MLSQSKQSASEAHLAAHAPSSLLAIARLALLLAFGATSACSGGGSSLPGDEQPGEAGSSGKHPDEAEKSGSGGSSSGTKMIPVPTKKEMDEPDFLQVNTVSQRVSLPLAVQGSVLSAQQLAFQLAGYDPGSLLRCEVESAQAYESAMDTIGGVSWGYGVSWLEDLSRPRIQLGFEEEQPLLYEAATGGDTAAPTVEIALPDIVAVTESAALFYSRSHGLLVVDLNEGHPTFKCATQLPGRIDQFFFHQGHLIAMTTAYSGGDSHLLHFTISGTAVSFVEDLNLGAGRILDSRRFNDKLVFYTEYRPPEEPTAQQPSPQNPGGAPSDADIAPTTIVPQQPAHRALHVYEIGDTLSEEMYDTLIDDSPAAGELENTQITQDTELGSVVSEWKSFGTGMWASQKYFVVTKMVSTTTLEGWKTHTWNVCTESHTVETPYQACWTEYEERPNPDYVEPDNSGGDRDCQGETLSACLVNVARVSNKTIQVPVGKKCEERILRRWYCDRSETRSAERAVLATQRATELFIYEYTEDGFIQVDTKVQEVITEELEAENPDAVVPTVTTTTEAVDLSVPGDVQTLRFQNDYLYVISEGVLQTYAMGGSSIVRTSTLSVVNDTLQSSLFSDEQLILSDFNVNRGTDTSSLRVVDLSNPAFPTVAAETQSLPGGHRSILLSEHGLFTIGQVNQFMGESVNLLKLGLFSDPFVEENAYLILGTDLNYTRLTAPEAQWFNAGSQRLLLPYYGLSGEQNIQTHRVGVSRIESGKIVSEGALVLPEEVQRIRPLPSADESYLSFGDSSLELLTPEGNEWKYEPVLEYKKPFAVYRLTEDEDYVELQRLGDQCRIFLSSAQNINQRADGVTSEDFTCLGNATAFGNQVLFPTSGIEFERDGSLRALSEDELAEARAAIERRPICVLSLELLYPVAVDPFDLPEDADVHCFTPEEYQDARTKLLNGEELDL